MTRKARDRDLSPAEREREYVAFAQQQDGGRYARFGTEIGNLVEQKNRQYGDAFAQAGKIMRVLYPCGIRPDQMDDALAVIRIVDKLFRVANGSQGDESPGRDIAGYGILIAVGHAQRAKR